MPRVLELVVWNVCAAVISSWWRVGCIRDMRDTRHLSCFFFFTFRVHTHSGNPSISLSSFSSMAKAVPSWEITSHMLTLCSSLSLAHRSPFSSKSNPLWLTLWLSLRFASKSISVRTSHLSGWTLSCSQHTENAVEQICTSGIRNDIHEFLIITLHCLTDYERADHQFHQICLPVSEWQRDKRHKTRREKEEYHLNDKWGLLQRGKAGRIREKKGNVEKEDKTQTLELIMLLTHLPSSSSFMH